MAGNAKNAAAIAIVRTRMSVTPFFVVETR
jgi:hypothetical protein